MTTSFGSARNTTPPPPPYQPTPSADRKYIVSPDCAGTRPTQQRSGHELADIVRQNDASTPWLPMAAAHKNQVRTPPKATSPPLAHTSPLLQGMQEQMPRHQQNTAPTQHLNNIGGMFFPPAGLRPLSVQRPDQAQRTLQKDQPRTCTRTTEAGTVAAGTNTLTDINNHPPKKGDSAQADGTQKLVVDGTASAACLTHKLSFHHPSQNSSQASPWIPIPRNVFADDENKIPSTSIARPVCTGCVLLSDQQHEHEPSLQRVPYCSAKELSFYLRGQTKTHDGEPRALEAHRLMMLEHMAEASSTVPSRNRSKPPPPAYMAPIPPPPSLAPPIPLSYPWGGGNPSTAATHHRRVSSNGLLDEELLRGVFAELMSFAEGSQSPSGGTNFISLAKPQEGIGRCKGIDSSAYSCLRDGLGVNSARQEEEESAAAQMIAPRNEDSAEKIEVEDGKYGFNFTRLTHEEGEEVVLAFSKQGSQEDQTESNQHQHAGMSVDGDDHRYPASSNTCETPLPLKNRPYSGSHVTQMEGSASSNSAASNRSQNSRNVDHRNAQHHHCRHLDFQIQSGDRQDAPSHPPPQEVREQQDQGQERGSGLRMALLPLPEESLIKLYHPFASSPPDSYQNETLLREQEVNPHSYCGSNTCTNNNKNSNTNNPTSFSLSSSCSYSQGAAPLGPYTPRPYCAAPLAAVARRSPVKSSRSDTPLGGENSGDSIGYKSSPTANAGVKSNFRPKPPQSQAPPPSAFKTSSCVVQYSASSPSLLPAPKGATPLLPLPLRHCQNDSGRTNAPVVMNTASQQQQQQHSSNPAGTISSAPPPPPQPPQLSLVPDVVMAGTLATPFSAPQVSTILTNLHLTAGGSSSASAPNRGKKGVPPPQPVLTKVVIGLALPSKSTGAASMLIGIHSSDTLLQTSTGRPRSRRERRRDARIAAAAAAPPSPSQPQQIGSDRSDSPAADPVAEPSFLPPFPLKGVLDEERQALHPAAVMPISISQLPPPGYVFIQCVERVSTYETIVRVYCVPEALLI